ncbi:hypothetical protein BGZ60DRAFT_400449 [Tricladium varicosporioides]|nr:hypothetical protein BGZ60DRAFT_400449 [Hymenoscyphus varicosporioides]
MPFTIKTIRPPLLNSANPWATTRTDLESLYKCPFTGAVTVRTSLLKAFDQNPEHHQYTFFSSSKNNASAKIITSETGEGRCEVLLNESSSLNTLGYSPISFHEYLSILRSIRDSRFLLDNWNPTVGWFARKPFIVSVTGTALEVAEMYGNLINIQNEPQSLELGLQVIMEINLSCPNIPSKPPPAYDTVELGEYIHTIGAVKSEWMGKEEVLVGIKTPPYTYAAQFEMLIKALEMGSLHFNGECPVDFITATNTLGSCLVTSFASPSQPALGSVDGSGIGGMAGDALHPLALGNVKTIRRILDVSPVESVKRIQIIGVGGVKDKDGSERMKAAGAAVVGVGTALGREGVGIFASINGESGP